MLVEQEKLYDGEYLPKMFIKTDFVTVTLVLSPNLQLSSAQTQTAGQLSGFYRH